MGQVELVHIEVTIMAISVLLCFLTRWWGTCNCCERPLTPLSTLQFHLTAISMEDLKTARLNYWS